jgi:hypothetical protein
VALDARDVSGVDGTGRAAADVMPLELVSPAVLDAYRWVEEPSRGFVVRLTCRR